MPPTNTSAALKDVITAVEHAHKGVTWPEDALAQVRATFTQAIGNFLTDQGKKHPDLDLWNGSAFADFKHYVLGEVVRSVVNAAADALPAPGAMKPKVFAAAANEVLHRPAIIKGVQDVLRDCCKRARIVTIEYDCPSPFQGFHPKAQPL